MPTAFSPAARVMGVVLAATLSVSGQNRPELKLDALRSTIRKLIPAMDRVLHVRVFEPIPIRIVNRDQLKAALARELEAALLAIQRVVTEPRPVARAVILPDRARLIASTVAARLAPRYLIRYVFDREEQLLVVPENLERLLDPARLPSRQVPQRVRFALVRELTRLADDETRRYADREPPADATLENLAARIAFLEGRAGWAAGRLVPAAAGTRPPAAAGLAARVACGGQETGQLLQAYLGQGRERARQWTARMAAAGDFSSMRRWVERPPATFKVFPALPAPGPAKKRPPDPLAAVLARVASLHAGEGWTVTGQRLDRQTMARRLAAELDPPRVKTLMASFRRAVEQTATHPDRGQIHFAAVELANPSAAYAWLKAHEKRLAVRDRRLEAAGNAVLDAETRTHDLAGYPVLLARKSVVEAGAETWTVCRVLAVRRRYFLAIAAIRAPLPWSAVRAFLEKIQPHLDSARFPG